MVKLLIRLLINAVAIWAAASIVPGLELFTGHWGQVVVVALVFGIINTLLKPVLTLLGLPFIILTLGLFTLVINGLMLGLTAGLTEALAVEGFVAAVLGSIVISIVSWFLGMFLGADEDEE